MEVKINREIRDYTESPCFSGCPCGSSFCSGTGLRRGGPVVFFITGQSGNGNRQLDVHPGSCAFLPPSALSATTV